jgi:hypothetical protein
MHSCCVVAKKFLDVLDKKVLWERKRAFTEEKRIAFALRSLLQSYGDGSVLCWSLSPLNFQPQSCVEGKRP